MSTNYWGISNDADTHSIGSDTFRREQRKTYDNRVEETEDVFNQHQVQSIFDNRHHAMTFEEDLNSVGESLVGYEHEDEEDNESYRTKEEVKLSLIKRRQRLRQMEGAIEDNNSIDFSLKLKKNDDSSFVSTMRDSLISADSFQGSLQSKKGKKKSKDKDKKKKKSKSKEKERKDRKKKSKSKSKEKDKKRKKKSRRDSSSESSSESESEDSESDKYDKRRRNKSKDDRYDRRDDGDRRRRHGESRVDKSERTSRRKGDEKLRRSEHYSDDEDSGSHDSPPKVRMEVDKRTGRCVHHPDVQLRRKSRRDGTWKKLLSSCPECVEEAKLKAEKKRRIDKSTRSGKSSGDKRRKDKSRGSRRRKSDSDSESSSSESEDSRAKRVPSRSNGRKERDADRTNPKSRSRDGRGGDEMSYTRTKKTAVPPPEKPSRRTAAENGARSSRQNPRSRAEEPSSYKSKSYHAEAPPSSKSNGRHHKSMSNVDSVDLKSASELMARVKEAAKSRRVTQHENLRDVERELMSQVAQLSIGSDVEEFDADMKDPKYRVLKKVVRSYVTKNMQEGVSSGPAAPPPPEASAHGYNIGDEGRRRDMVKDDNKETALMRIAGLRSGDGAFIRRTEGNWTFATVKSVEKDAILFIVHVNGSTKAYKTKYWVTHVRTLAH